jgi:hypothetical protein
VKAAHIVSVWAAENRLVLAQTKVAALLRFIVGNPASPKSRFQHAGNDRGNFFFGTMSERKISRFHSSLNSGSPAMQENAY